MKLNAWMVGGGLLIAYALWRAYAPAPVLADAATTSDTSQSLDDSDTDVENDLSQSTSNAIGSVTDLLGFEDLPPLDDDDDIGQLDSDSSGDDSSGLLGDDNLGDLL